MSFRSSALSILCHSIYKPEWDVEHLLLQSIKNKSDTVINSKINNECVISLYDDKELTRNLNDPRYN